MKPSFRLAACLSLALAAPSAAQIKSAGSGGEDLAPYRKAMDDMAKYAQELGMAPPPKLVAESRFAASKVNKYQTRIDQDFPEIDAFRKGYRAYQKDFAECGAPEACPDKPTRDGALTKERFNAALLSAGNGGQDLKAGGKWLCSLSAASQGYFGFYAVTTGRSEAYSNLHGTPVASRLFPVEVLRTYAKYFNEQTGANIQCDVDKGCWLSEDCETKVANAIELLEKARNGHKKLTQEPEKKTSTEIPWTGKLVEGQRYDYWATWVCNGFYVWAWDLSALTDWYDCTAPQKHWLPGPMVRHVAADGTMEYYVHPDRKTGKMNEAACKRYDKWLRAKKRSGAKLLP